MPTAVRRTPGCVPNDPGIRPGTVRTSTSCAGPDGTRRITSYPGGGNESITARMHRPVSNQLKMSCNGQAARSPVTLKLTGGPVSATSRLPAAMALKADCDGPAVKMRSVVYTRLTKRGTDAQSHRHDRLVPRYIRCGSHRISGPADMTDTPDHNAISAVPATGPGQSLHDQQIPLTGLNVHPIVAIIPDVKKKSRIT